MYKNIYTNENINNKKDDLKDDLIYISIFFYKNYNIRSVNLHSNFKLAGAAK
jgi:hypothetical protein